MKYAVGGVTGTVGQALEVEVPLQGKPAPAPAGGEGVAKPDQQPQQPAGPVAKESGDDVMVDPPVRNLPQWDGRWGQKQIAGKKGAKIDWQENGCNASTAAMTLRWFAEDCPAGKVAFPRKSAGSIDQSWYSLAMAESMWPNADPPGKVALDGSGRIDVPWIFAACAEYLRSGGTFPRSDNGDVGHPAKKAYTVESPPSEGWLSILKKMLKTGPVIMGIGAPAGHYVIAQGVIGGAVAIVDPGNVLYQAAKGGGGPIQNWQSMASGFADGSSGADKVRMPQSSQWPGGSAPGNEADPRAYNLVSGQFLQKLLDNLVRLVSLTYPDGATFGGGAQPQQQPSQQPQPQQHQSQSQGQDPQPSQPQQSQPQQQPQQQPQPKSDQKHDPLAKGDEHENVRVLQFLLNYWQKPQKGLKPVTVSGKLDDDTVALMQKFQKASGIAPTDAPDDATWNALEAQSAELKLLGNVHVCALPLHPDRKWFAGYSAKEGKLSTRLFDTIDYGDGKSGKPILYITKNSTDDDGTSTGGDSTKQGETTLKYDDGTSLNSNDFPFLAIGGAHEHDFKLKHGDIGAVIANGKVAFGLFGDSSGGYKPGTPGDDDLPPNGPKGHGTPLFKCHRSGESSVRVHKLLDWKGESEKSTFIWIVFPGSSMCNSKGRLPKSVDSDAVQKRGAELLAKLTGGSVTPSQSQPQQQEGGEDFSNHDGEHITDDPGPAPQGSDPANPPAASSADRIVDWPHSPVPQALIDGYKKGLLGTGGHLGKCLQLACDTAINAGGAGHRNPQEDYKATMDLSWKARKISELPGAVTEGKLLPGMIIHVKARPDFPQESGKNHNDSNHWFIYVGIGDAEHNGKQVPMFFDLDHHNLPEDPPRVEKRFQKDGKTPFGVRAPTAAAMEHYLKGMPQGPSIVRAFYDPFSKKVGKK